MIKAPIIVEVRGGVVVAVYGPSDQGYCLIDWDNIREPDPVHGKWDREQEGAEAETDDYGKVPLDTAMNISSGALQKIAAAHPEALVQIRFRKGKEMLADGKDESAKQP